LQITGPDYGTVAHAVPVLQFSGNYIGENLRIFVRMGGEPSAWFDNIVVHHNQGMKTAVLRIVVVGKGEGKFGMQPAVLGSSSVFCPSYLTFHMDGFYNF